MISGVVIEKIQEANKVSASYKADDEVEIKDEKQKELYVRL